MTYRELSTWIRTLAMLASLAVVFDGCATGRSRRSPLPDDEAAARDAEEMDLRGKDFIAVPDLKPITFGYDLYTLSDEARAQLRRNAEFVQSQDDIQILVEGHCDERGTIQYNLALGQRRAKAVRDYYIRLGIPGGAVATISYGEEQPLCSQPREDCYQRNRRAATKVRIPPEESSEGNP